MLSLPKAEVGFVLTLTLWTHGSSLPIGPPSSSRIYSFSPQYFSRNPDSCVFLSPSFIRYSFLKSLMSLYCMIRARNEQTWNICISFSLLL